GGTVFKITPNGALTSLYNFCSESECADGANPGAGLVLATNGYLYGTTYDGGVGANRAGTFFKITPNGTLTTLYTFDYTDGGFPVAGLIQGINGKLFGTTEYGGANGDGTIFNITPNGTPTTLYSFCSESDCADGEVPQAALVQVTHGTLHALYGTTTQGGANGDGTVFGLFGP
ncbi:MAG: choice-of-anchor tandem repeat GloVer-containing protein, partial [Mycobacterium sp.]